jgi:hypothetical protein
VPYGFTLFLRSPTRETRRKTTKMNEREPIEKEGFAQHGEPNEPQAAVQEVVTVSQDIRLSLHKETSFTTEPKLRIRRGHNITIRRCYEIGKFLQQLGYVDGDKLTRENLSAAVDKIPGMDQRTHNRYIGFSIYSKRNSIDPPHVVKKVKGYLERLKVIEPCGNGLFVFNGFMVPTSYEGSQHTIANLCVFNGSKGSSHISALENVERIDTTNDITTTTHNTHTNQLSESNLSELELAILNAKPLDKEPDRAKIQWSGGSAHG